MRLVAGKWRGRPITAPQGDNTRPTSDRTRETLFAMLTSRLGSFEDLRIADLFAGSGALGLEALSRGAASAVFVEQDAAAIRAIKKNIDTLGAGALCDVRATSVMTLPLVNEPLDVIFLDPPYATGAGAVAIDRLQRLGWIGPATWVCLETGLKEEHGVRALELVADRKVGKAKINLLRLPDEQE